MWKGYYGKEPFDLRLTALRMLYKLPFIAAATILGAAVLGGVYYAKNVLLRHEKTYAATSVYRVEYAVDNVEDMMKVYVNETSWNTYMQSRLFLDAVQGYLAQTDMAGISGEELAGMVKAQVLSDVRIPSTVVTADSPEKAQGIAWAVESAMTLELADAMSEIVSVMVIQPGDNAEEVLPDVRVGRAIVLSALLSCFFAVVILLLKETGEDSIWLPASIWKRYGVKVVGTVESRELSENMRYLFRREGPSGGDCGKGVFVCAVQEEVDSEKVLGRLEEICPDIVGEFWSAVCSPLQSPQVARQLREAEGILLAVKAGSHAGRALERALEYLEQQDCHVTAAILWDADERLLRRYDFIRTGSPRKKGRPGQEA